MKKMLINVLAGLQVLMALLLFVVAMFRFDSETVWWVHLACAASILVATGLIAEHKLALAGELILLTTAIALLVCHMTLVSPRDQSITFLVNKVHVLDRRLKYFENNRAARQAELETLKNRVDVQYLADFPVQLAHTNAVTSLNEQIASVNARRGLGFPATTGISPIRQRVARVLLIKGEEMVVCLDDDGKMVLSLKKETSGRFKGVMKQSFHELVGSGPDGSHSSGDILVDFYLEQSMF